MGRVLHQGLGAANVEQRLDLDTDERHAIGRVLTVLGKPKPKAKPNPKPKPKPKPNLSLKLNLNLSLGLGFRV